MQILHHVVVEVALSDLGLQVAIIFVSRVQLNDILLRGQQFPHFPFLWLFLLLGLVVLLLRQDQQIELSRRHFVPRVLVTDHLLEQHLLKIAVVGLAERNVGSLEVFGEFWGRAVVGSDVDGLVVSGEDDGRRAVVVNVGVMRVADPKQVSGYGEEYSLTFIYKGDPFA